jgi:hypothetical protein
MSEEIKNYEVVENFKPEIKSKFQLGILPFDPLFVLIAIIYGVTR